MASNATKLAQALIVTAEVIGHELSPLAAEAMVRELRAYPQEAVAAALRRCSRELSGRLTLASILQRVDDGHPGAEEAWAACPRDEAATVVWTDQMAQAFGVARPLIEQGDHVAARMAFRETYTALVRQAREGRAPAKWIASLGTDHTQRTAAVLEAAERHRILPDYARALIDSTPATERRLLAIEGKQLHALPPVDQGAVDKLAAMALPRRIG